MPKQFKIIPKFGQIIRISEFTIYPIISLSFTSNKSKYLIVSVLPLKYEPSVKSKEIKII